jgi:hypothetical protein
VSPICFQSFESFQCLKAHTRLDLDDWTPRLDPSAERRSTYSGSRAAQEGAPQRPEERSEAATAAVSAPSLR